MRAAPGRLYLPLVVAFLAAMTMLHHADPFFIHAIRLIAFDSYQKLAPQSYDPELPVRVVVIDDESLSRLGQWPWPRTLLRDLVLALDADGAAVVAFDVLFAEPDRSSIEEIAKHLPPERASALLEGMAGEPSNDALLLRRSRGARRCLRWRCATAAVRR
jgi:adenylate cyclase